MEGPTEDTQACATGEGDHSSSHNSTSKYGKVCMEALPQEALLANEASTESMAPISPIRRELSNSERSLEVPEDASTDEGGLCNEAYDERDSVDVLLPSPNPTTSVAKTGDNVHIQEDGTRKPEEGHLERSPRDSSEFIDQSVVSQKEKNESLNRLPDEENIGSRPFVKERSNSNGTTSPQKELRVESSLNNSSEGLTYTPVILGARKGICPDPSITPGMLNEGTPIMEERGTLTEKIVEKRSQNEGTEKTPYQADEEGGRWKAMKMGMHDLSRPIMRKHNPLPPDPSKGDQMKYSLLCPPHGQIGRMLTYFLFFLLFWGSLVYITHEEALPGGNIFSLFMLVIVAQLGGLLVAKVRLPPLLGMLLVGIMFRSVKGMSIIGDSIKPEWSSSLRSIALVVILIRAGLGLDPEALRKLSFVVLRLAMIPCLVETTVVAIVSHFVLGFPWMWGFMLGFVLAAVSPAVVVPCLLSLNEQGYGVEKGIPTLVIAAASIDDVIAISGFGVCLGMIFASQNSSPVWQGFKGPLEFGLGIGFGIVVGVILWLLPNKREEDALIHRFLLLFVSGLLAVFGSKAIDFGGAGALGCLCVAFIAGYGWRKQGKIGPNKTQVNEYFNYMWMFFQPLLFGLIGTEIRVSELDLDTVGYGVLTLAIGLSCRVFVSFFAVMGGGLNLKERLFVALAWLPKATVQAAIGSTALDYARDADGVADVDTDREIMGMKVLTIAVLVILVTAPIGAIAIMLSAPKLLKKASPKNEKGDVES